MVPVNPGPQDLLSAQSTLGLTFHVDPYRGRGSQRKDGPRFCLCDTKACLYGTTGYSRDRGTRDTPGALCFLEELYLHSPVRAACITQLLLPPQASGGPPGA